MTRAQPSQHWPVKLAGTAMVLPGRRVSTAEVASAFANRTAQEVQDRTGIAFRWWAEPGATIAGNAARAVQQACAAAGIAPAALTKVILCCSTGFDQRMPATVNAVLDQLETPDSCDGLDINNACMGFLSAFDLAARSIATGYGPIAVVASELGSRNIRKDDPRPYVVFGDAAAAAILIPSQAQGDDPPQGRVLGSCFGNRGALRNTVVQPHEAPDGGPGTILFLQNNDAITDVALLGLGKGLAGIFERTGLGWDDIDWVVPHQPNGAMLQLIAAHFAIPPRKLLPVVQDVGNIGSASTAVGLATLLVERNVLPGQRILLLGVGAGLAWGAVLIER